MGVSLIKYSYSCVCVMSCIMLNDCFCRSCWPFSINDLLKQSSSGCVILFLVIISSLFCNWYGSYCEWIQDVGVLRMVFEIDWVFLPNSLNEVWLFWGLTHFNYLCMLNNGWSRVVPMCDFKFVGLTNFFIIWGLITHCIFESYPGMPLPLKVSCEFWIFEPLITIMFSWPLIIITILRWIS